MAIELRTMTSKVIFTQDARKRKDATDQKLQKFQKVNEIFKTSSTALEANTKSVSGHVASIEPRSKEEAVFPNYQTTLNMTHGVYTGCHQYGIPHGYGIMIFNENDPEMRKVFRGNFKNGKAHGSGELTLVSGITYEGSFKEDEITGSGKMQWPDGRSYEGTFLKGKKINGKLRFISGEEYTGDFKDDKYHGKGVFKFSTGERYEGDFVEGLMTGQGKKIYKSGMIYEGTWVDGKWISGTESLSKEIDDKAQNESAAEHFLEADFSFKEYPETTF